jgi:hypothetical protein
MVQRVALHALAETGHVEPNSSSFRDQAIRIQDHRLRKQRIIQPFTYLIPLRF